MSGNTCAGTWVTGTYGGKRREVYIYQVADNRTSMRKFDSQAVVAQTGFNPVIAMELLELGEWRGTGVVGPEAFDPRPFMQRMRGYGFPYKIQERIPTA
jgi:saccharopine dehydrogenase (NAD+, L-lysine-forming)